jgi:hypothetical protein
VGHSHGTSRGGSDEGHGDGSRFSNAHFEAGVGSVAPIAREQAIVRHASDFGVEVEATSRIVGCACRIGRNKRDRVTSGAKDKIRTPSSATVR